MPQRIPPLRRRPHHLHRPCRALRLHRQADPVVLPRQIHARRADPAELTESDFWLGRNAMAATNTRYRGRRVLFARIGWMLAYGGPVPGDERPVGGGSYT